MNLEYLKHLLSLWTRWMRNDDHGLGYPKRSLGMRTLNAVINELDHEERKAIHHFHLGSVAPMYKEIKYELAIEHILKNITKRLD